MVYFKTLKFAWRYLEKMAMKDMSKRYVLAGVCALVIGLAGCGEKKSQEAPAPAQQATAPQEAPAGQPGADAQLPTGHPQTAATEGAQPGAQPKVDHGTIKTQKVVKLSDEVKAKWKEVKLEITETASKSKDVVAIKVGSAAKLKKEGFSLKVEALVPDYSIAENRIESRSNEAKNPAVLVELLSGDKSVAKGWIFRDYPEFNSFNDPNVQLKLVAPGADKAAARK